MSSAYYFTLCVLSGVVASEEHFRSYPPHIQPIFYQWEGRNKAAQQTRN